MFFAIAAGAQGAPPGAARGLPSELAQKVDKIANDALVSSGVPSASVAIVRDGQIAYLHAYGLARIDPPTPANPQMRYEIGSISKQFTAAALLLLQQDGKLSLDDPVAKYLPGLTRAQDITIRMLLTHTSGYSDYWPQDYLMLPMARPTTTEQILDTWAKAPLDFEPGTKWQYSNTNYVIAARIIELVTGEPYLRTVRSRILQPLDLRSAIDVDTGEPMSAGAEGYQRAALGPLRPALHEGKGWMFGAFELAMTAEDLARWDLSIINRSLLKPESYAEMFTAAKLKDGSDTGYGLGVEIGVINGQMAIEHSGESSGFVADNIVFPDARAAIVVLTNEMAAHAAGEIATTIEPLLLANPSAPESAKDEAQALAIFKGLQEGHIDRGLLTPDLNGYFSEQTLQDFASSLKPLGQPLSFHQTSTMLRGGMMFHGFEATFASRRLTITTYEKPDGKLEQYLVIASQ